MDEEIARLERENLHLRCTMREAAREILAFWECHASEGGLGPHSLLDRLLGKNPVTDEHNPYPHHISELLDE